MNRSNENSVFEPVPQGYPSGKLSETVVQGVACRYWEYGNVEGDSLLLIHGFRGDHHGLELIASGLTDFRVLIPDLPGFGKSEAIQDAEHTVSTYAAWLIDFISQTGQQGRIHLVGHSFGSIICSYAANTRPGLISRLSLINPISQPALAGSQKIMSKLAEFYYDAGAQLPEKLGFALLRSRLITRLSSEFMMKNSDPKLRRFINGQHAAYFSAFASRNALLQAYKASITYTASEFIAGVQEPVQMIVAAKDDLGTLGTQQQMFLQVQKGRFDLIEQVGHLIHYETPLLAAKLIRDFHQEKQ